MWCVKAYLCLQAISFHLHTHGPQFFTNHVFLFAHIAVYKSLTAPFVLTLVNFVVPALLVRMAPLELYGTASTEFLVSFCRNVVSRITFFLTFLITFLRRELLRGKCIQEIERERFRS